MIIIIIMVMLIITIYLKWSRAIWQRLRFPTFFLLLLIRSLRFALVPRNKMVFFPDHSIFFFVVLCIVFKKTIRKKSCVGLMFCMKLWHWITKKSLRGKSIPQTSLYLLEAGFPIIRSKRIYQRSVTIVFASDVYYIMF